MDTIDFQLLVGLHENARQSFRSLGNKVPLSAPAVRDRLQKLEKRGILQGYWLSIDPNIFDRENVLIFFGGEFNGDDAKRALEVPDIAWAAWKVDGGLTIQAWSSEKKSKTPRRDLEQIPRDKGFRAGIFRPADAKTSFETCRLADYRCIN